MLQLDPVFRGGASALLLLLSALLWRDARRVPAGWLGALFALGVAAYVGCSAPGFAPRAVHWHAPLLAPCLGNPVVFWLFAAALFDDDFKPRWPHLLLWAGLVGFGFGHVLAVGPGGGTAGRLTAYGLNGLSLAFALLALRRALAGWSDDLVQGRRRLRAAFVAVTGLYMLVILAVEVLIGGAPPPELAALNAFGLLAATFAFALPLLAVVRGGILPLPVTQPVAGPRPAPVPDAIDPAESELLAALIRAMEQDRVYRAEGLSIGALAERLGVPEYRLRRLINQRLGYRNFSAFLNRYRLADVTEALADPAQAEVPILTIALDAGFQSLGPFNRAFKAETGMTPTEYRRQRLG